MPQGARASSVMIWAYFSLNITVSAPTGLICFKEFNLQCVRKCFLCTGSCTVVPWPVSNVLLNNDEEPQIWQQNTL